MQETPQNIDIIHWRTISDSHHFKFVCYFYFDGFYKIELEGDIYDFPEIYGVKKLHYSDYSNISECVNKIRHLAEKISLEDLIKYDPSVSSTNFFKKNISPYLREEKINKIIYGK